MLLKFSARGKAVNGQSEPTLRRERPRKVKEQRPFDVSYFNAIC
jgi:hypothetical protein